MTKSELIKVVARKTGLPKVKVELAVNTALATIIETVRDEGKVDLSGLGKFERRARSARIGRNPVTGAQIKIKPTNVVAFKASKKFKEAVK